MSWEVREPFKVRGIMVMARRKVTRGRATLTVLREGD